MELDSQSSGPRQSTSAPQPSSGKSVIETLPIDVLCHVISFLDSSTKLTVSLVSKRLHKVEGESRLQISIRNCLCLSPERLLKRYPSLTSITINILKYGSYLWSHPFHDSRDLPALDWIETVARGYPKLAELKVSETRVTSKALDVLATSCWSTLKTLRLVDCEGFKGADISELVKKCTNLEILDLEHSDFQGQSDWPLDAARSCPNLKELSLIAPYKRPFSEGMAASIAQLGLTGLRSLHMNSGEYDLISTMQIAATNSNLEELRVGQCVRLERETGKSAALWGAELARLERVRSLRGLLALLSDPPSAHHIGIVLPIAPRLTCLDLSQTFLKGDGLRRLMQECSALSELWLSAYPSTTGHDELRAAADFCPRLRKLYVERYHDEMDGAEGLSFIFASFPDLETLSFRCEIFDGTTEDEVVESLKDVRLLKLRYLRFIQSEEASTEANLDYFWPCCPNLTDLVLGLKCCLQQRNLNLPVDHQGRLVTLATNCPKLKILLLRGGGGSRTCMEALLRTCKELEVLSIVTFHHCKQILEIVATEAQALQLFTLVTYIKVTPMDFAILKPTFNVRRFAGEEPLFHCLQAFPVLDAVERKEM